MPSTQRFIQNNSFRTLAILLGAAVCLTLAAPAMAASNTSAGGSWGLFLGRLHVVVLHLPIGLLAGAFAIELFGLFRRSRGFDVAAGWLFVLGFVSSVVAVVTGLLLGTEQATDKSLTVFTLLFADADQGVSDTLARHMWIGVALMMIAGVAAVLKIMAVRKQWIDKDSAVPARGGIPLGLARVSLVAVMTAMPFVGHLGGNMTHGQDYLTEHAPSEGIKTAINLLNAGTTEEVIVAGGTDLSGADGGDVKLVNGTVAFWNAKIQPALNQHCTACHNATKQNGKLRLDTLEWAMKGGSIGGTIEPGEAEFSEIYRRVILPPSHEEFMPTNVKKYGMMSQQDIILLGEWLTEFDGNIEAAAAPRVDKPASAVEPEPVKPAIDPAALKAIVSIGGNAQSLSQEENAEQLTVKFAYLKDLAPASVAQLESAAGNIAWLTFEGSSFGDEAAKQLPEMPALTRLNLKDSAITDNGLAELPDMTSLKWLNLFGTAITDAGLESLTQYGTLEKLYVTGTSVTAEGVEKMRQAMPNTQVYSDHDGEFQFTPVTPEVTPGNPDEDDKAKPAQAATPVNTTCPVGGVPIKPGFVSTFEGKTVGFCCGNCKSKFDADPKKFAAKLQ